jgi:hypothetical protein
LLSQRIIPASVHDKDAELLGLLEVLHHLVEPDQAPQIRLINEQSIYRRKIIYTGELQRMPTIVE